jgi:hypothetical protein
MVQVCGIWFAERKVVGVCLWGWEFVKGTSVSLERVSTTKVARTHAASKWSYATMTQNVAGEVLVAFEYFGAFVVGTSVLFVGGGGVVH